MFYREAGEFKTSYAADLATFPIGFDFWRFWVAVDDDPPMRSYGRAFLSALMCPFLMAAMIPIIPNNAWAFDELKVSRFEYEGNYIRIFLDQTERDRSIVCAAYDKDENLIASTTSYTDNLATEVIIKSNLDKDPASVKCVFND